MNPQTAGPPPALLAMLAARAGGAPGVGGAAPPPGPDAGAAGGGEREPMQILKQMIALGERYQSVEPDAEDKATMAKLLATLHQYLAKDQQDAEAALGGGAGSATRTLRKLG
jgi:hypothetical protein